ncbi:GspE/PulE family protein [Clostridium sp. SYSU_GA19001]|uniref:GspE/PulE family protein n=1 Tax=Clostridium caldaquaticum TaxID=2940653 RepID=UPI002077299A|nr:GspE/PulE family protein [Clostridium caldaquaticum]MCM8711024.1 GspE/PulE family protein [Clostridium caldaquaticum]
MSFFSQSINISLNYIDLKNVEINPIALKMVSKEIMSKHCLIPFNINEDIVYIAMSNPQDNKIIEDLHFLIKKKIKTFAADKNQILNILSAINEKENADIAMEQLKREYGKNNNKLEVNTAEHISLENSPIIKLTNSIIIGAIKRGASDIHIEPFEDIVLVRYRVDGILHEHMKIPKDIYPALCIRIKVQSGMDIADKRLPQDGKLEFKVKEIAYDLRISSLPTMHGEKIAIRILYKRECLMTLKALGFSNSGIEDIERVLKSNHGIILVTGPTGSGKTTTLYAMLNQMDKIHKNIVTIEDPVEYTIKGINQVNVNSKAGLTFESGLRSILRQDPNVIMIGEIRDEETAQIAIRAAITGHLVISTLHTNDAASSILRLIDMGVPNYLAADSLLVCIAQRLVRVICSCCKVKYKASDKEIIDLALNKNKQIYKGKGCHHCNNTGYKHRTVVYEIMYVDEKLRRLIVNENSAGKLRSYNEIKGMLSLRDYCRELVKKGVTTYEEYIKLCSSYL